MAMTTRQILEADPPMAWFIDNLPPVEKWGYSPDSGLPYYQVTTEGADSGRS